MDPILFRWSHDYVGDLAETVALVWPRRPGANREPELSEVVDALRGASRAEVQRMIEAELEHEHGRMVYELKLLTVEGRVVKLYYDARSGMPLQPGGHDRRK